MLRTIVRFRAWFLEGARDRTLSAAKPRVHAHPTKPWWQVMCLTGVDYFSTLAYQPYIAFLAVGALSPVATLFLVALTLFGAVPMYWRVARESPNGQGSIAMLEQLLPGWRGKTFVLCLLGFAATDFIITITLSAADAAEHLIENPFAPHWLDHRLLLTFFLLVLLGTIFLKGFAEAIYLAVGLVMAFMGLNVIVIGRGMYEIITHPEVFPRWQQALAAGESHGSPWLIFVLSLLAFPKLALGLSGFETGVTVMPLIKGEPTDTADHPAGRIRNAKKLLLTAAVIMSLALIGSSLVTTLLIPPAALEPNGKAAGRALSYLAHEFYGVGFGTLYDLTTAAILWYAGASAMAGLLNLIPRYLPRYGMAPEWARANRPLVVVITGVTLFVTWFFDASIEAQGDAYATGVLMLMLSASIAVVISARRDGGWTYAGFIAIALVFTYTTLKNIRERPTGLQVCLAFILSLIFVSLVSRALRATELRTKRVVLDDKAKEFLHEAVHHNLLRIAANRPQTGTEREYARKRAELKRVHRINHDEPVLFFEVEIVNPSEFNDEVLEVHGVTVGKHRVLRCESPAVPNAIAAFLLHAQKETGVIPDVYFGWTEGSPIGYAFKYLFLGEGDTAPVVHEVLRKAVDNPEKRPCVHVG